MTQLTLSLKSPKISLKNEWLEESAIRVTRRFAGMQISADDIHGILPYPRVKNWFGILMNKLSREGRLERVGFCQSKRPEARGRMISLWKCKY